MLIVGGGLSGCSAARAALARGACVTILDKGPWGHSGTSGINWGHDATTAAAVGDAELLTKALVISEMGLGNQDLIQEMGLKHIKYRGNWSNEQLGMIFDRLGDRLFKDGATEHGYLNRYHAQFVKRMGATIFDRMHVLNLVLAEDSTVAGVVAIDMRNGSAHLFRAKATVLATGSFAYISGWNGIGAHTIASPENTGDGVRMLLEAGVPMRDMEYLPTDFVQYTPLATRHGMGAMGASIVNCTRTYDGEGNPIMTEKYLEMQSKGTFNNPDYMGLVLAIIHDGKGSPNGGIYVDTTEIANDDRYYRHAPHTAELLGYELPTMVELTPEQWESAASPWNIDAKTCAVPEVPGLFYAASMTAAYMGACFYGAYGTGLIAGEGSADFASKAGASAPVNWDRVSEILSDAYGVLYANPENGVHSLEVYHEIQNCYWDNIGAVRSEEGLNKGLTELDRIEAEVMANMVVPSKSKIMNSDWQRALESRGMLMCAKAVACASLQRKESRAAFCRVDYPFIDNENGLFNTKTQLVDGRLTSEHGDVVDTYVSTDEFRAMVEELGGMIGFPIETA